MVAMRLMGLDPGLRHTGWGVIDVDGSHLQHVGNGTISPDPSAGLSERLLALHDGLAEVIAVWQPREAAVEETFVNRGASSTLKLGQARGVVMLAPAIQGISVAEYSPNTVKKAIVGVGHAGKEQIHAMVSMLLPGVNIDSADSADALAVAICHAHHAQTAARMVEAEPTEGKATS
jgi:crossover junction endodeoxyribonuclease RuvC